jgi:hypothetical protein
MEYIITGLRAVATASRMISMDSDSSVFAKINPLFKPCCLPNARNYGVKKISLD